MRISSSTISMAATRNYTAEAKEEQYNITRYHEGGALVSERATKTTAKISRYEIEGGTAVFTSGADGITRADKNQLDIDSTSSKPVETAGRGSQPQVVSVPRTGNWFSALSTYDNSYLKQLMQLLEKITGGKIKWRGSDPCPRQTSPASGSFRISAQQASLRYQETVAMLSGQNAGIGSANAQIVSQAVRSSGEVNGHWTRQTVQSGFVAGEEHTAFASKGTAVTADGRTIDFHISMEMSRSFESAYVSVGKEEVFTDPLVINLDDSPAGLSDVSFYFDLDCDGVEEELSALDEGSGFLALDKNGDGEINDGSELFGARTGDGFGELAQYDQDGNGWIDEGDEVFSKLSVWVKCGTGGAKQLSLAEADVGAIFLGSQNTQYALTGSAGETDAMIRKTGVYLKESGGAGTVQHVDFKA